MSQHTPILKEKVSNLAPWLFIPYNPRDFSYQSCRFCHRDAQLTNGLWKYGVRHYICDLCRKDVLADVKPPSTVQFAEFVRATNE